MDEIAGCTLVRSRPCHTIAFAGSLAIATLMILACAIGLVCPDDDLFDKGNTAEFTAHGSRQSSRDTLLLGSIWFARHGGLVGLLLWPGALFYLLYHDIVFLFARLLGTLFLLHLMLATISLYALACRRPSVDGMAVRQRLAGRVPEKVGGGVLVGLGVLFLCGHRRDVNRPVKRIPHQRFGISAAYHGRADESVMDSSGGVLLWRRKALGYVVGSGLLFQASMLFIGLVTLFLLQPLISGNHFRPGDVLVVLAMGLVCFIPFAYFVWGATLKQ